MTNDDKFERVKRYFENYGGTMRTQKYAKWLIGRLEELGRENESLRRHIEIRDHVDEQDLECKRCGFCYCECPEGKKL